MPPELRQAVEQTIQEVRHPGALEEVKAMLESTEKGGVRNSIQNCLTVFQHDPELSGAVAKNLLTERIDLLKPIGRETQNRQQGHDRYGHEIYPAVSGKDLRPDKREKDSGRRRSCGRRQQLPPPSGTT